MTRFFTCCMLGLLFVLASQGFLRAEEPPAGTRTLEAARELGLRRSRYLNGQAHLVSGTKRFGETQRTESDRKTFENGVAPLLKKACHRCHGPDDQEAGFRVDRLNPDLLDGQDEDWWLEVQNVLSNAEMPPADAEVQLSDAERGTILEWLSSEIQVASHVRRGQKEHSSFRRLTRYEFTYALQDLLGLPYDFGRDLPPETSSEEGFQNNSEYLQMTPEQFAIYRELARQAIGKATVRGVRPDPLRYQITMDGPAHSALTSYYNQIKQLDAKVEAGQLSEEAASGEREALKKKHLRASTRGAHFLNEADDSRVSVRYRYGSSYRFAPEPRSGKLERAVEVTEEPPEYVLVLPPNAKQHLDLGKHLPPSGTMRLRVRARHVPHESADQDSGSFGWPGLQINFGFQPSNNSHTNFLVGAPKTIRDHRNQGAWYEWDVHLGEISRNAYRERSGRQPNPTEYILLINTAKDEQVGSILVDRIEVVTPFFESWPPRSHRAVFPERKEDETDSQYARRALKEFMSRAWRRNIASEEVDQKMALLHRLEPVCEDQQEALSEVFAVILSSGEFLYLGQPKRDDARLSDFELATRLSMFLWSSLPDERLFELAREGRLHQPDVLVSQVDRMLADDRSNRFSQRFVRQWLGLELLDYLDVDQEAYRRFDRQTLEVMKQEPDELFRYMLATNRSIMDFLHADYVLANQSLARHYGIEAALGNEFQKVRVSADRHRGGLLTQAGLMAMNSDGKDSNPLKRGIWLLQRILNDPPPPPPPAVPEIDLADPEILKMTLKERLEDHRRDVACRSCHQRIDPWGIAFENFDAVGAWRTKIGDKPVDATSVLFNKQELNGVDGLKRYLLETRQDQFAQAMVHKVMLYALGRPLTFADRAELDAITAALRTEGDGLATLIRLVATSELFLSNEG